jgi:hypothetical protein
MRARGPREARTRAGRATPRFYDAYNAEEVFLTSTSLCICPVTKVNGAAIGPEGQVWGPTTQRLADAYRDFVGHDHPAPVRAGLHSASATDRRAGHYVSDRQQISGVGTV